MRNTATFFAALADVNRLRLLYLMQEGEICVCYLQGVLQTNQPKVSRHLAYLRKAGLVEARREGKWMYYRLAKMDKGLETIIREALKHIGGEAQIKQDDRRLKQISCCPSRYGLSSPEMNGKHSELAA
ncbi:MAG TPA: metalloregulator ArsR/SmtB family transcription factor [Verrucomicrobiae bacterium]|jgi:ArsR family transcriptional regulator|nr:metalloregulator ArsR/SmtB family transcription factor [Verrucomicrobiae bacterium]